MKETIRKEAFCSVYTSIGIIGIEKLIDQMEDISQWGWLIANNVNEEQQQEIAEKALDYGKINILAGILDQSSTEIFKAVYTDQWGKLSTELYEEGLIENLNEGATQYYFFHPINLIQYIENNHSRLFEISNKYILPACAYNDQISLARFAETLVKSDQAYLLGSILGQSPKGSDEIFPHESIRDLLEQLNNDKVDLEVYTGYVNSRGARWVRDGSDQKQLGELIEHQSHLLEVTHPHTATVLRYIARGYMREAQYDHLHAELDP